MSEVPTTEEMIKRLSNKPYETERSMVSDKFKINGISLKDIASRLESLQKKLDDYENGSELPCGHIGVFLTLGEEGFHCSKCGRIYTDWVGMPDKLTAYHGLVEKVKSIDNKKNNYIEYYAKVTKAVEDFEKEQGK